MSENDHTSAAGDVRLLHRNLQIIQSAILVAATALRYQNADRDKEIAQVLEYLVGDRLATQIERTGELLAVLQASEAGSSAGSGAQDSACNEPYGIRELTRPLRYLRPLVNGSRDHGRFRSSQAEQLSHAR